MSDANASELAKQVDLLTRQVQWLLDKEGIRNTKQLYCRLVDSGRYDDWEKIFTDDYTCEINGPPTADGSAPNVLKFPNKQAWVDFARASGSKRAMVDATAGREGQPDGGQPSAPGRRLPGVGGWNPGAAHHMHGGEIEFTGPDTARAIWPSQFDFGNGYYDEEYRKVDGMWKIARGKFFSQARREYSASDYPYPLEVGSVEAGRTPAERINFS
jgi:hypothetical protein